MPNIKSAKKRMTLSAQAREKNRGERARIRTAIKRVRQAESQDATRRLFHPNRVARIKSSLTRHVNALGS